MDSFTKVHGEMSVSNYHNIIACRWRGGGGGWEIVTPEQGRLRKIEDSHQNEIAKFSAVKAPRGGGVATCLYCTPQVNHSLHIDPCSKPFPGLYLARVDSPLYLLASCTSEFAICIHF